METPALASTNTGRPTFAVGNSSDITLRRDTGNSNTGSAEELPPSPNATAPTLPDRPVRPQPAGATAVAHIEPDQEILAHLRVAATEEHELQIISATIEVQAAAPVWSLQQRHCPLQRMTPLLQDLLKSFGSSSPHLLAISLHTTTSTPTMQAFPWSILLLEAWPQRILPSATIIIFNNNGQQFLSIEDAYIDRQHANGNLRVSSKLQHRRPPLWHTTTLHHDTSTIVVTALCQHIRGQVDAG
jgi:hypothetical protein